MKIIVDKMPEYPYECRNCRLEGDMEFHSWVCQVGEEKHICEDTKKCPYFIGLDEVLNDLRLERRKYKDEQIIADVMKSGFANSNW